LNTLLLRVVDQVQQHWAVAAVLVDLEPRLVLQ